MGIAGRPFLPHFGRDFGAFAFRGGPSLPVVLGVTVLGRLLGFFLAVRSGERQKKEA